MLGARDGVVEQRAGEELSIVGIVADLFVERLRNALHDTAVDLPTPEPELRRWAGELLRRARRTVRGLDGARVVEVKVCARPLPADGQSIVGRLPGAPGVYVAVTHSGVTLAAHLADLITADLTTGTPPGPLTPYTPARFTSGIH